MAEKNMSHSGLRHWQLSQFKVRSMALSLSSAVIPFAALATFGGVYILTPASTANQAVPFGSVPVETAIPHGDEPVSISSKSTRARRRSHIVEYTYSEQRKLDDASQVASDSNSGQDQSVYYSGCRQARAAGVAPLYRGDPGYRSGMDGDGDGIACEPYRGR
jgi:hypothetical protein